MPMTDKTSQKMPSDTRPVTNKNGKSVYYYV